MASTTVCGALRHCTWRCTLHNTQQRTHHMPRHLQQPLLRLAHKLLSTPLSTTPPSPSPLSSLSTTLSSLPISTLPPPLSPPFSDPSSPSSPPFRPPPRRPTLLRNLLLASVLSLAGYSYYASHATALSASPSLCSPSPDEYVDLLGRTRLTSHDLIQLYSTAMRHSPSGLISLDAYARIVEAHAHLIKAQRHTDRLARKAAKEAREQRWAAERAAAEASGDPLSAPLAPSDDAADAGSYWDEMEEQEERDLAELTSPPTPLKEERERALRSSLSHRNVAWWELLCLFRCSTPVVGDLYDVRELAVGTAQLCYDHGDWAEAEERLKLEGVWKEGRKWGRQERWVLRYQPWKKLEVAWRVSGGVDPSLGGRMRYADVRTLIQRMLRTGHFAPDTLVQGIGDALHPQHVLLDADYITRTIFQRLHRDARYAGPRTRDSIEADPLFDDPTVVAVPLPPVDGSPADADAVGCVAAAAVRVSATADAVGGGGGVGGEGGGIGEDVGGGGGGAGGGHRVGGAAGGAERAQCEGEVRAVVPGGEGCEDGGEGGGDQKEEDEGAGEVDGDGVEADEATAGGAVGADATVAAVHAMTHKHRF